VHFLDSQGLDIRNAEKCKLIIESLNPDWIVNTAAYTNVDLAEEDPLSALDVNANGVANLIQKSERMSIKIIQISTDYVFDGEKSEPYKPTDVKNPVTAYGKSKSKGEDLLLDLAKNRSFILRTSWLYSPYGKNFVKSILQKGFDSQESINVVEDQMGQPTNAEDLADLIINLISEQPQPGVYHASNSGIISWYEFAQAIFEFANLDVGRVIPVPSDAYLTKAKRPKFSAIGQNLWSDSAYAVMGTWDSALQKSMQNIIENLGERSDETN
jgi:dTDP-4-dehydrorhamnose reductase